MDTDELRALVWGSSLLIAVCALIATYLLVRILRRDRRGKVQLFALALLATILGLTGPAVDWLLKAFSTPSVLVLAGPVAKWAPALLSLALGAWLFARRRLSS